MTINLLDYKGTQVPVEIEDNIEYIAGEILSGDMVMMYPFYKDTSDCRMESFDDGSFQISRKNFNKLNKCTSSYEAQMLD